MRGHNAGVAYRRTKVMPYVEIWEQPLFWRVVADTYHLWDTLSYPIMKHVSRWHEGLFGVGKPSYVPLDCRRDIRCSRLEQKHRNTLAIINITTEQYNIITGKVLKEEEPRHDMKEPIPAMED